MKKSSKIFIWFIVILLISTLTISAFAASGDTIVYRTRTGECYHREGCSYLKSCYEVTLYDAVNVYHLRACSRCKPPTLDSNASIATVTPTPRPVIQSTPKPTTYKSTYSSAGTSSNTTSANSKSSSSSTTTNKSSSDLLTYKIVTCGLGCVGALCYISNRKKASRIADMERDISRLNNEMERLKIQLEDEKANCASLRNHLSQTEASLTAEQGKYQKSQRLLQETLHLDTKAKAEDSEKAVYQRLYGGKTINECAGAPADCYVTAEGYPARRGPGKYGRGYSVYISYNGSCFHSKYGCSGASKEVNIIQTKGFRPCKVCGPVVPDYSWLPKYKEIQGIKQKYNIQ